MNSRLAPRVFARLPMAALFIGCGLVACSSNSSVESAEPTAAASQALACTGGAGSGGSNGLTNAGLELQELTSSCGANQAQQFFKVLNTGSTSIRLSDIKIRFWVNDTSVNNAIAAFINTPGCIVNAGNPSCAYPVPASKTSVTATKLSSACGPDSNHQANWEITVSSTDSYAMPAGSSWTNLQIALRLANGGNFAPGTNRWFSPCLVGRNYQSDNHFAIYYQNALVFSSGINAPDCRAPHGTQPLSGHITPAMKNAALLGPVAPTTPISLAVGLQPKAPIADLQKLVQQVSDPNDPLYRHHLKVTEFRDRFGASAENYQKVVDWAAARGLTVKQTYPNNLLVSVSGTAAAVAQALYANLNYYKRPDGTSFYAPDREPSADTSAPLLYISNLNNMFVPKRSTLPPTGSDPWGCYLGDDLRTAYAFDYDTGNTTTLTGAGQCVGLLGTEGFTLADMQQYWTNNGRPIAALPSVRAVNVDSSFTYQLCNPTVVLCQAKNAAGRPIQCGMPSVSMNRCRADLPDNMGCCGVDYDPLDPAAPLRECFAQCTPPDNGGCTTTGAPCFGDPGGIGEQALDIQMVLGMAPAANVFVYFADSPAAALQGMATASTPCNQLSSSISFGHEPNIQAALLEFAVQGQSFFLSSGDSGASQWGDAPASPYITTVGGTSLATVSAGGPRMTEEALTFAGAFVADGTFKDLCGGSTNSTPIPWYQKGIPALPTSGVSTAYRNAPDVSTIGADVATVVNQQDGASAGTSVGAPVWAAFMALANEQNTTNGLPPVGFANPVFYAIGRTAATPTNAYATSFNDIQSGSINKYDCSNCKCTDLNTPAFTADVGFDVATGLGSPTFGLIRQLTSNTPVPIRDAGAGMFNSCALRLDGRIWCWGANVWGQLGNGTQGDSVRSQPVVVSNISTAIGLSVGSTHNCALVSGGTIQCWGHNDSGQLGNGVSGPSANSSVPVTVSGITSASAISAGHQNTCALLDDRSIKCWGLNTDGQLGDGTTTSHPSPVAVKNVSTAVAVSVGGPYACAVLSNGQVQCWGGNYYGTLGNGTTTESHVPVVVSGISTATAISAAGANVCALLADHTIRCWGNNSFGALGNPVSGESHVPVAVTGITTAKSISIGTHHACAVLADQPAKCWGSNTYEALGTAGPGIYYAPHTVDTLGYFNGLGIVNGIAAGDTHSCAWSNTSLYCWGDNQSGQTGDTDPLTGSWFATRVHLY